MQIGSDDQPSPQALQASGHPGVGVSEHRHENEAKLVPQGAN